MRKAIAIAATFVALGVGAVGGHVASDQKSEQGPTTCSITETGVLVNCEDGVQLEYENGAWWPEGTPESVRQNWNK
jgi:hypothetical protein